VADPDEVIRHDPARCRGCGAGLARAPEVALARRQVFDLPPIAIRVTEHELVSRRCGCGVTTTADAPTGVNAPVQYGARIKAVMVYLYMGQYLSKHRTAVAMSELFGTPVSDGTVSAATARAAGDLDGFCAAVSKKIAGADVAHFDETGFRADGKLHWLHSASTTMFTMITCHRWRGREAMNAAGILPTFTGIAVHDAWAPYDTYPQMTHSLCNAHLLRELIAVTDHHARSVDPKSWCWAAQVIDNLLAIKTMAQDGPLDPSRLTLHRELLVHGARIGATTPTPGPSGRSTGPWPGASTTGSRTTSGSPPTHARRGITMRLSARSAWPNSVKKSPAQCAPWSAPSTSQPYAATSPPPRNTASTASTHSPNSPPETPGNPKPPDQLRFAELR